MTRRAAALAAASLVLAASSALGQSWTADVYAGGTRYDALAGRVGATNLVANLRHQARAGALSYLTLAAPLDANAALWGAAGAGDRLERALSSSVGYGADLAADAYVYRDDMGGSLGGGGVLHALALLRLSRGRTAVELRGGGHQHRFSFPDTSGGRAVFEAGARGTLSFPRLLAQADARWLRASEGAYPYVGVQLATPPSRARAWGWVGKWLADELDSGAWGVGASVAVGSGGELWLSVRREASDPLYQGSERTAWNVGFSRRLSGPRPPPTSMLPRVARGQVQIRLPESARAHDSGGAPSVAGEFSEWRPVAMRQVGGEWVADLPLAAGVYRFSFVSAAGEWFVPEHYPGRMDDGFGGYVALLVVP